MNIEKILKFIKSQKNDLVKQSEIFDIYEGNILPHIEKKLEGLYSEEGLAKAKKRIPPINILPKTMQKLSQVYSDEVTRNCTSNTKDADILSGFKGINDLFQNINELVNLQNRAAIEPYIENGTMHFRILPAHTFLVYSDDDVDTTRPTVFIKLMGSFKVGSESRELYHLYTSEEFVEVDSKGEIYQVIDNAYGVIPFIYCNYSKYSLMPKADIDSYEMSLLIPITFTDLNYAMAFLCNSLIYAIDTDLPANFKVLPNSILEINSQGDKTASMGTIKPEVDSDKALKLLFEQLTLWLDSKGLKASVQGQSIEANASGIAKLIDNADNIQANKVQISFYRDLEEKFWNLVKIIHNTEVRANSLKEVRGLSDSFKVNVKYPEIKPIVSESEKLGVIKLKLDNGLTSKKRALRDANPELDDDEIEILMQEIEEEKISNPIIEANASKERNENI